MTDSDHKVDIIILGELAAAVLPPVDDNEWLSADGAVYVDDGEEYPDDREETLIARFFGPEDQRCTNARFFVMCATDIPTLITMLQHSQAETRQARSDAARLAEEIEDVISSGDLRISISHRLKTAVHKWERSLEAAGLQIGGIRRIKPAGVQADRSERPSA